MADSDGSAWFAVWDFHRGWFLNSILTPAPIGTIPGNAASPGSTAASRPVLRLDVADYCAFTLTALTII